MKNIVRLMICLLLAPVCWAGVYKYVDADGNTVYSDKKPDDTTEDVERINVKDSYTNSMRSLSSEENDSTVFHELKAKQASDETLAQSKRKAKKDAHKQMSAAEAALDKAKQVRSGDMFPNPSGGVRYTPQYHERIEAAQKRLDDAKKQFQKF